MELVDFVNENTHKVAISIGIDENNITCLVETSDFAVRKYPTAPT